MNFPRVSAKKIGFGFSSLLLSLCAVLAVPSEAAAQTRAPGLRFQANRHGDITFVSNTIYSCADGTTGSSVTCANARAQVPGDGGASRNNNFTMALIDIDGDPSTTNSSSADLALPPGATVAWAGLYWACHDTTNNQAARQTLSFRGPSGGYVTVTGTAESNTEFPVASLYQGFADVTNLMDGNGTYTIANMRCSSATNYSGGWTIAVIYEDPAEPLRNLVVFDAIRGYSSAIEVTVDGFLTPAVGDVHSRVGIVFYDGDRGASDTLELIAGGVTTPLTNSVNPANDVGNSTISRFGSIVTTRNPAYNNTLGYDADLFETVNALPNEATSAVIRTVGSGSEGLGLGVLTFATDIFQPVLSMNKTVALTTDVGGDGPGLDDVLTYTIVVENQGNDPSIQTVLTDPIPAGTQYVAGSLTLNGASVSDVAGDDVGEYSVGDEMLIVRLGSGATTSSGGSLALGDVATVTFQVRISTTGGGQPIRNTANVEYYGQTIGAGGTVLTGNSDGDPTEPGEQPTEIVTSPVCGDGNITPPETCDTGISTTGCSASCRRQVVVTTPIPNETVGAAPTLTGTANPGASIVISVGGVVIDTITADGSGNWSFTFPDELPHGTSSILIVATDDLSETSQVTLPLSIDAETFVEILQPGNDGPIGATTPEISGRAEPGASVEVFIDGSSVGTVQADAAGNWTLQLETPLSAGPHDVTATATDAFGNTATDDDSFEVDLDFPVLEIRSPGDGTTTSDSSPVISGIADPGALVTVTVDGVEVGTATADFYGQWELPLGTPLSPGQHEVIATTTNEAGHTARDTHSFTVDTSAPLVTIDSPANGARTSDPSPQIQGTADPGAEVDVFVGGVFVGTATADGSGNWAITVPGPLTEGEYPVRAVTEDGSGNTATASGSFVVDLTTFVTIEVPTSGGTVAGPRPTFSGTGEPGAEVEVVIDGVSIGTTTVTPDGTWSLQSDRDLDAGTSTISVTATDDLGNTMTPPSRTFEVGQPECVNDATETRACGLNGLGEQTRVCTNWVWGEWGQCVGDDECVNGATEERACGLNQNGTQSRTCAAGQWGAYGACDDPDECEDGSTRSSSCGQNGAGTQEQLCVDGQWQDEGECEDPDACDNGTTRDQACGRNGAGTQEQLCVDGQWQDEGACEDPDVCDNGATRNQACGSNGSGRQEQLCVEGQWQNEGTCEEPIVGSPGLAGGGACSHSPLGNAKGRGLAPVVLLGLFGAGLWARRRRSARALGQGAGLLALGGAITVSLPGEARAQGFQLNPFRPAETSVDGFAISSPEDLGHLNLGVRLTADYALNPLVVEGVSGDASTESGAVVKHLLSGNVTGALGLWNRVVLFAGLPATLYSEGDNVAGFPSADGTRLGDLYLGMRGRLLGEYDDVFALGLQGTLTTPLGDAVNSSQVYSAESGVTFLPKLNAEVRLAKRRVRLLANIGARIRPEDTSFTNLRVGHELTYGLGVIAALKPDVVDLLVEAYGSTALQDQPSNTSAFFGRETSPAELLGGLRFHPGCRWEIGIAGGPGLTRGYGSPDFHGLLQLGYANKPSCEPPNRPVPAVQPVPVPEPKARPLDSDGDGILDADDRCPNEAEDKDGFQDEDGCPDPDNDGDGILDAEDECPNDPGKPEDKGCPRLARIEILRAVEFGNNSDEILESSFEVLEEVRRVLESNRQIRLVLVEGHTDSRGAAGLNLELSRRRARSVMRWLIERGVAQERLNAAGCGMTHPVASNDTAEGRQTNRRVEFLVLDPVPPEGVQSKSGCKPIEP